MSIAWNGARLAANTRTNLQRVDSDVAERFGGWLAEKELLWN